MPIGLLVEMQLSTSGLSRRRSNPSPALQSSLPSCATCVSPRHHKGTTPFYVVITVIRRSGTTIVDGLDYLESGNIQFFRLRHVPSLLAGNALYSIIICRVWVLLKLPSTLSRFCVFQKCPSEVVHFRVPSLRLYCKRHLQAFDFILLSLFQCLDSSLFPFPQYSPPGRWIFDCPTWPPSSLASFGVTIRRLCFYGEGSILIRQILTCRQSSRWGDHEARLLVHYLFSRYLLAFMGDKSSNSIFDQTNNARDGVA